MMAYFYYFLFSIKPSITSLSLTSFIKSYSNFFILIPSPRIVMNVLFNEGGRFRQNYFLNLAINFYWLELLYFVKSLSVA